VKRFLLITLGITGLYLGLNAFWLSLTPWLDATFDGGRVAAWEREAADVREASREADNRLPPESRLSAYRLGFHVGYCSNVLGSFALSGEAAQAKARAILRPRITAAEALGRELGVGELALLPVSNAEEFGRLPDRLEADELRLAERLEAVTSRRHRHLLLLGLQVGAGAALVQLTGGDLHARLRALAGRHATLAGVPAPAWEPVTVAPAGATPDERVAAYQATLNALDAAIGQLDPLASAEGSR
jgi:hypothetical protein